MPETAYPIRLSDSDLEVFGEIDQERYITQNASSVGPKCCYAMIRARPILEYPMTGEGDPADRGRDPATLGNGAAPNRLLRVLEGRRNWTESRKRFSWPWHVVTHPIVKKPGRCRYLLTSWRS